MGSLTVLCLITLIIFLYLFFINKVSLFYKPYVQTAPICISLLLLSFIEIPNYFKIISLFWVGIYCFLLLLHTIQYLVLKRQLSKITIVPVYNLNELKLYEVGTLLDGEFSFRDVLSTLSFLSLNKDTALRDDTEFQLSAFSGPRINEIYNLYLKGNGKDRRDFLDKFTNSIYRKLKEQGYFRYNPYNVKVLGYGIAYFATVIVTLISAQVIDLSDEILKILLVFSFCFVLLGTLLIVFSFSFHENFRKTIKLKQNILGYKMYLETVEYYKVKYDIKSFEKYLPYFICLGVHVDRLDELVTYVTSSAQIRDTTITKLNVS